VAYRENGTKMTLPPNRETMTIEQPRKRSRLKVIAVVGLVALVIGGYGLYRYFSGDAPDPVDLDRTVAAVTTTVADGSTTTPADGSATTLADGGVEGSWTVDTSIGDFAFDDATASFAGFRVDEELAGIGAAEAVGRTPEVSGSIEITGTTLQAATIEADLTAIVSNEPRREAAIQRALDTSTNPLATFTLTSPVDFGEAAATGARISVTAVGDLTVNGVTNPVEIPIEAQLVEGNILVTGSLPIVFADYDVTAPRAPIVLSVADNGTLEFQLWLS